MKLKVKAHTGETITSTHRWQNCSCGKVIMRCRCLSSINGKKVIQST
jgi:hypothetical protein